MSKTLNYINQVLVIQTTDSVKRIEWVDALKFLGILAIYAGHFRYSAGKMDEFVFIYHVPLFFFISGFFAKPSKKAFFPFLKDKAIQLLIPYLFFVTIFTVYVTIRYHKDIDSTLAMLGNFGLGIRNTLAANSLWFILCLFTMSLLHYGLQKIVKKNTHLLAIAILFFIIIQTLKYQSLLNTWSQFWNIDSALLYYLYFVIGILSFKWINEAKVNLISWLMFAVGIAVAVILYVFGRDYFSQQLIKLIPSLAPYCKIISISLSIPYALILFYVNIRIAKLIAKVRIFGELGRETLLFCGTENLVKVMMMNLFNLIAFKIPLHGPLSTLIYSLILLLLSYYLLSKPLTKYVPILIGKR